ncbi:HNH endonuclease [Nakamurella flavida]|uniref:HNH endonuclease n=1 Tax=Nakamurella flavida TaxID=363630 RepID=A0A938YKQ9_9ACTN|nr:HNH endonuclease [Nakamurella flavida]MBM9475227.1 HNH endonuclease [Nakamurella flavida]MDP9776800.1 hypothetical protein [Nakamurella flavida]
MDLILLRDGDRCCWCATPFGRLTRPTTDHLVPRVKGGPSWLENEVAACPRCNGQRGHRSPTDWATQCEQLGRTPDRDALARQLHALLEAIDRRGGQRRARQYALAQLRRITRG